MKQNPSNPLTPIVVNRRLTGQIFDLLKDGYFYLLWQSRGQEARSFPEKVDRIQKRLRIVFIDFTWVLAAPMFIILKYGVVKFDLHPTLNLILFLFLVGFLFSYLVEIWITPSLASFFEKFSSISAYDIGKYARRTIYLEIITYIIFVGYIYLIL